MRVFFGFLTTLLFIPIFITLTFLTIDESKSVRSFNSVIDEDIELSSFNLAQTSYILDSNNDIISELSFGEKRNYLTLNDIPHFLLDLFITTEDQNFYKHPGFDLTAVGRALQANAQSTSLEQGASTITQQLARYQFLSYEKTYNRKLSEILYAYALERNYSKNDLLELYVNAIYFKNGVYGIEAASQFYFQKHTNELSKAQLTFLAAIPNNPTVYDPLTNFDNTKKRQERLVKTMEEAGKIENELASEIINEKIVLNIKEKQELYPDFTTYVEAEFKQLVAEKELYNLRLLDTNEDKREIAELELDERVELLLQSGITIKTALEPQMQTKSLNAVRNNLRYNEIEGAAAVIRNDTNEVIALVGGKNYKKHDFNRAYQAFRQPGSTIKPLIAYAPYFDRYNAPLSESINANNFCIGNYCPKNYGGGQYGNVTLESAFINSFNTPAVRLLQRVGIETAFSDLEPFNFEKVSSKDHNYPSAIGGFTYGMSPLELTSAFTVFANGGSFKQPRAIKEVVDNNGNVIYKWDDDNVKVWNESTVNKVRQLMNKVITSGTGKKAYVNKPYFGGKTGTSNDYKDLWFVGLTDEFTAGVWIGRDKGGNIYKVNNIQPQLYIWRDIVK